MTEFASSNRRGSSDTVADGAGKARQAAARLRQRWQSGETPDLARALDDQPELRDHRTIVIQLAFEEFRLRQQAGERLTPAEFAERFPSMERSLNLYINVHSMAESDNLLAAAPLDEAWPDPGDSFLDYDILSDLGRGTYGRVYEASQRRLGNRRVVLKVAWRGGNEAAILGRLRHPNIVPIHSIEEDETTGLTGFCMPLLGQATLSSVIVRLFTQPRPPRDACEIFHAIQAVNAGFDLPGPPEAVDPVIRRGTHVEGCIHLVEQLADALAHAHSRGIYHRDLKPSNVLMSPAARPLLLDFNLSVDGTLPRLGFAGTLPFMAPEAMPPPSGTQAETNARHFDPRSDLFSLGVILYQLLTGKLPFGALPETYPLKESAPIMRERHMAGPPPVEQLNPQVGRSLAALVKRMLAYNPEERIPDAGSLATALRKELALLPRVRRRLVRHRRKALAVMLAAALLASATGTYLALRPSFAHRMLKAGIAKYEAGNNNGAIEDLGEVLKSDPASSGAHFYRGLAYKRRGDYSAAIADFAHCTDTKSRSRMLAARAYCHSRIAEYEKAFSDYQECVKPGNSSAIDLNNFGYECLKFGKLKEAEKALELAATLDGSLQAAHFNLVCLHVTRDRKAANMPEKVFDHATRALRTGPESGELDRFIAELYALGAAHDPKYIEPAILYTDRAIQRGVVPRYFTSNGAFSPLLALPEFQAALKRPADLASSITAADRLVDPEP
jgi:eukaryotic-like serine/threonine-protein kinase